MMKYHKIIIFASMLTRIKTKPITLKKYYHEI